MRNNLLRKEGFQLVLLALPFVLAEVLWDRLPARVVTHWDFHNQPNGWMPKAPGLLLPPTINVLVTALFALAPRIDPRLRRRGAGDFSQRRAWRAMRLGVSGFIAGVCLVVIAAAAGWQADVGRVCLMGMLILFAIIGNFLGRLEPNYLLGIRTPWTLEDPTTWRATHRLGSRVMVFGSLALLLVGFFVPSLVLLGMTGGFVVLLVLGSLGYSAWFYQRHAAR